MSIQDSINLFNTKINSTLWTRQEFSPTGRLLRTVQNPVVLPEEKYYKILQKKFVKVGGNTGYVPAFNKQNIADYYANERTGDAIAVVNSVKVVDSVPTEIAIATYYDHHGDIAILNRFDQTGRPHDNYFHIYGNPLTQDEIDFYKKYLSDRNFVDNQGLEHDQVYVPHIHFNTKSQTLAFSHHDKANAISIYGLTRYLTDLKNDFNPKSLLNTIDMGMPFLDMKKAKVEYTPNMLAEIQKLISYFDAQHRLNPGSFSDYERETIEIMKSLINIDDGNSASEKGTNGPSDSGTGLVDGGSGGPTDAGLDDSSGDGGSADHGDLMKEVTGTADGNVLNQTNSETNHVASNKESGKEATVIEEEMRLTSADLKYIAKEMPPLEGLNATELGVVKDYISDIIGKYDRFKGNAKQNRENINYRELENIKVGFHFIVVIAILVWYN